MTTGRSPTATVTNGTAAPAAPAALDEDDPLGWQHYAACRGLDSTTFYPDEPAADESRTAAGSAGAGLGATDAEQVELDRSVAVAKAICASCTVSEECLEYALLVREKDGVWGGTTARERLRILRARLRARARARAAAAAAAQAGL